MNARVSPPGVNSLSYPPLRASRRLTANRYYYGFTNISGEK
jgi:hypothetical protein